LNGNNLGLVFPTQKELIVVKGYSQVGAEVGDPDGIEGVAQLDAPFTDIEHKERNAADDDGAQVLPVNSQRVVVLVLLSTHKIEVSQMFWQENSFWFELLTNRTDLKNLEDGINFNFLREKIEKVLHTIGFCRR